MCIEAGRERISSKYVSPGGPEPAGAFMVRKVESG